LKIIEFMSYQIVLKLLKLDMSDILTAFLLGCITVLVLKPQKCSSLSKSNYLVVVRVITGPKKIGKIIQCV